MKKKERPCFFLTVWKIVVLGLFLVVIFSGFLSLYSQQEKSRQEKWIEDIDQLASELPAKHKNLFYKRPEDEFRKNIQELKKAVPELSDEEIVFSLSCIVASVGDAHTSLYFRPNIAFPLTLYWFKDGIYVIDTAPEYKKILHCRLTGVNQKSLDEVIKILSAGIPHENTAQIKKSAPYYLVLSEFLYGAGIIDKKEYAEYGFQSTGGEEFTMELKSISMKNRFPSAAQKTPEESLPLYRRNRNKFYISTHLEEQNSLYVQYNSCQNIKEKPFSDFVDEVFQLIDEKKIGRLIIDLRSNGGGNSIIFYPMLREINAREEINQKGKLYVIVGRRTFSSAVLNAIQLRNQTNATFVGEPTGGRPNHFGEVKNFMLINTRLNVSYSTKYFTLSNEDTDSFYPDITVEQTFKDYRENRDPVMETIIKSSEENITS